MADRLWTRRDAIAAGFAAAGVGSAGCLGTESNGEDVYVPGAENFSTLTVPADIERFALVDAQQVAGNDTLEAGTTALLDSETVAKLPTALTGAFDDQTDVGLDLTRAGNLAFVDGTVAIPSDGSLPDRGPGAVLWADLHLEDLLDELDVTVVETDTYRSQRLHRLEGTAAVAVEITDDVIPFETSVFAVGESEMVRAVVDNWQGAEVSPADDHLYGAFETIPVAAPIQFAFHRVDRDCDERPAPEAAAHAPVTRVSGFLTLDEDEPVASVTVQGSSRDGAREIETEARSILLGRASDDNRPAPTPAVPDAIVGDVTVDRTDLETTVAYHTSPDEAAEFVDAFIEATLCSIGTR